MQLFQSGNFKLHSGASSSWKIDCDTLTVADWATLALMLKEVVPPFRSVYGVPRGGLALADALSVYTVREGGVLVVDDVLTTGNSLYQYLDELALAKLLPLPNDWSSLGKSIFGAVVFARGICPAWVRCLFQLPQELFVQNTARRHFLPTGVEVIKPQSGGTGAITSTEPGKGSGAPQILSDPDY